MVGLFSRDDWGICCQREVNPGVWHQVSLELSQVHVQGSIKPQRGSNGRDNLTNQSVQVCVRGTLNVKITTADVVDGFIVNHESTVRVLKSGVSGQNGVVGLNNSCGYLRSW